MTNDERIQRAREWREAAQDRLAFTKKVVSTAMETKADHPEPWWSAQENIIDSMNDRINLIDGLFPELS